MFYFYVLENGRGDLYFGSTSDLKRRLAQHRYGNTKTTKNSRYSLIYYEAYKAEDDARRREDQIKLHGQAKRQLKERIRASRLERS